MCSPVFGFTPDDLATIRVSRRESTLYGAVVGAAAMIDGMVARYAEALGETPQVWLTGEGVQLVARHIWTCWDGADDLVFEGLRLIWEKNHPNR